MYLEKRLRSTRIPTRERTGCQFPTAMSPRCSSVFLNSPVHFFINDGKINWICLFCKRLLLWETTAAHQFNTFCYSNICDSAKLILQSTLDSTFILYQISKCKCNDTTKKECKTNIWNLSLPLFVASRDCNAEIYENLMIFIGF